VSAGGDYGCLAATKGACENKTLVRRTLVEKVIVGAVQKQIADPAHIAHVLQRVQREIAKLRSDLPDTLKLKDAGLTAEQRRLANFVDFIGEGGGSQAVAKALVETERRVDQLADDVDALRRSREKIFRPPPIEWKGPAAQHPAGPRAADCALGANPAQPPRPHPPRARHAGQSA
jgi:hypothetical protein